MDEIFSHAKYNGISARYSYQKLKLPHRKTNQGLRAFSYVAASLTPAPLNAFKHNIKNYYFRKGNKKES